MLFLELALIRLVSAHNVYVRYFTNFVLLASFLGIGLGFLRANSKRDSFSSLPFFLLLTIAFVMLFPVGQRSGATHGASAAIAPRVALPATDLHPRHARHDGLRGRRRSRIRHLPSPACLPSRHHRKHPRDHPLHDRLDPPTAPGRLDTRRRPSLRSDARPARNTGPLGGLGLAIALLGVQWQISGDLWSPYYRVDVEARQARRKNADLREREPTPIHLDPGGSGEGTALLRLPVSSHPGQPAGRGAHRRGRLRQRRRPRSRPRRGACRRGRDRPGPPGVRSRAPPEPAVSGPAGPCSRGGWPRVPRAERSEV